MTKNAPNQATLNCHLGNYAARHLPASVPCLFELPFKVFSILLANFFSSLPPQWDYNKRRWKKFWRILPQLFFSLLPSSFYFWVFCRLKRNKYLSFFSSFDQKIKCGIAQQKFWSDIFGRLGGGGGRRCLSDQFHQKPKFKAHSRTKVKQWDWIGLGWESLWKPLRVGSCSRKLGPCLTAFKATHSVRLHHFEGC